MNLNECYCYSISTKSVIWQTDTDCSPFYSLDVLPSCIKARRLKTNLPYLTSNLTSNVTLKQEQFACFSYLHMYLSL